MSSTGNLVLLLSIPRCGSTWLFDCLRCLPQVAMQEKADLFAALTDEGRRYPMDLSDRRDGTLQVETQPGLHQTIPACAPDLPGVDAGIMPSHGIEKIHPSFFHHDVDGFLARLSNTVTGEIRLVLALREPADAFRSFLSYQERNPGWYSGMAPDRVVRDMERNLRCMLDISQRMDHVAVDFDSLLTRFDATLSILVDHLFPGFFLGTDVIRAIRQATATDRRDPSSPFLRSDPLVQEERERIISSFDPELARCNELRKRLLRGTGQ